MIVRELITLLGFDLNDGPLKKYDKQIDATKDKSNMLAKAAHGVGTAYKVAAAAVALGVGWISKNIIDATIEMEGYRSQLQAFTGDADSAAEALSELRDKTIDPLFGTGNLVNAYKQLRTVGLGAQETSAMIDVLGDVANGSVENFNMLTNTLQKVAATGKFSSMQMNQLATAGFGAADMAQALGKSEAQLRKDLEEGKIGFNELTKAMQNSTLEGGRFYQNAARQALTLSGSIKILQDVFSSMGDAIGTKVLPSLVSLIRYVTNFIKLGSESLVNFGANAFDKLIHIIYQVLIFFEVMQMRIKRLGLSFDPLKKIFQDVFGLLGTLSNAAVPLLHNIAALIIAAFRPIQAFVSPIIESLKPIIKDVFGFLSKLIESLIPKVGGLTPLFGRLGQIVGGLISPALKLALGIKAVNTALTIGKGAMAAFKTAQMGAKAVTMVFSGDLLKMRAGLMGLTGSSSIAKGLSDTFGILTGKMSVMKAAADGNRVAMLMLNLQMLKTKVATIALGIAQKIQAVATGIATAAQTALNAVFVASPIGWIVLGVMALIAAVILLVKNWDKVGPAIMGALSAIGNFFKMIGSAIAGFFKMIWSAVVSVFKKIVGFVKKHAKVIVLVIGVMFGLIPAIIAGIVYLIIKNWAKIKDAIIKITSAVIEKVKQIWQSIVGFFSRLFDTVRNVFLQAWNKIVDTVVSAIGFVKDIWRTLTNFFSLLWDEIVAVIIRVWDGIKNFFFSIVENVKGIWSGLISFFTGLWEAIKEGPSAVVEYISNIFTNLWANITEKFFGFVNTIKEGWEKIKGFLGGVIEGAVNFVTGGESKGTDAKPVNDLIVTPEGKYSTHPDDYIMAMKEPSSLMEALTRFLGQGGMQPAYAGGPADNSMVGSAIREKAQQNTYNNSSTNNTTKIDSKANITVNVPAGTTAEQASSIARQVDQAVKDSLAGAIGGARGTIPSPEARRL